MKIGDTVKVVGDADESVSAVSKYVGMVGKIVEINNDRPALISVKLDAEYTAGFWPEELGTITGNKALCNECPSCNAANAKQKSVPKIVHNDTEIYVQKFCPDCGYGFTSVYQFDRHDT